MPAKKLTSLDYETLDSAAAKNGASRKRADRQTLKPTAGNRKKEASKNLVNPRRQDAAKLIPSETISEEKEIVPTEIFAPEIADVPPTDASYGEQVKQKKVEKKAMRDRTLLGADRWLRRNGHGLTYLGLYLFSILVFYRPYELVSSLDFLAASAFYFALATVLIYLPTQLATESSLTILTTEVKCVLAMAALALLTMPIAKDASVAWATFNDTFSKAVVMFVVMVNVVRTRRRLLGLLWLSLSIGIYLSYTAIDLYLRGEAKIEGYRVGVEMTGIFGNPNDLALHLVTMMPLAVALALGSRNKLVRLAYFAMAALFVAANAVTFSRGGFLGLIVSSAVLVWKLGRRNRLNISLASLTFGGLFIALAPGNYGLRLLSIFVPSLDPVGSAGQRSELLQRSLVVTARNPWGIGIGNFPIVGINNLVTHNAFTQVSTELGLLGLAAYLILMISPLRKLGAIERAEFAADKTDWFYYLSIGLQASLVGYMVSSFFVAVAYNWFVYYLVAYAVAFRRIYKIERGGE